MHIHSAFLRCVCLVFVPVAPKGCYGTVTGLHQFYEGLILLDNGLKLDDVVPLIFRSLPYP